MAASTWPGTLPTGAVRDEAVAELGNRLLDSHPERALTTRSLSIGDSVLREGQIEDLLHSWLLRAKPEARAWMAAREIPVDILDTLDARIP